MRMCLPRLTTSTTSRPVRSTVASEGQRRSDVVSTRPPSAAFRRCAARQTTSPSGTGPLCLSPGEHAGGPSGADAQATRRGVEAGGGQRERQGVIGCEQRLAVGTLDREPAERARPAAGLVGPPGVLAPGGSIWPGKSGAVGVGGICGGEDDRASGRVRLLAWRARRGPQPVDGAGGRELRGSEAFDEIAAPDAAG